jgi:hypothetical protein
MNIRKLLLSFTALVGLSATAFAQTQVTQATVARVSGKAIVTLPDGSVKPLTAGMQVAQGSTITTGADGDVYLETHKGYVTAIKADSVVDVDEVSTTSTGGKVTAEVTTLNLKNGNLVAKLDPSKKAVNQYAVRTPKGVAAARGTTFVMQYKGAAVTISVVNGVVSVVAPALFNNNTFRGDIFATGVNTSSGTQGQMFEGTRTVSAGQTLRNDQATFDRSLGTKSTMAASVHSIDSGEALAEANSVKELMALAVATVAVAAQNGIGGTTPAEAAAVAKAVFAAVPEAAAQAAAIMNQSGVTNPAVTNAIKSEVPASQAPAFDSSLNSGTFTQTTGTTSTTTTSGRFGQNSTTTTTATTTTTTPQPVNPTTVSRSD